MEKSKLFEYAIIWNPTSKQENKGKEAKLLVKPILMLAKDPTEVSLIAARAIPEKYLKELKQIDSVVRTF